MSITYKNPPIVEAVCEFCFKNIQLKPEDVEEFYEKIKVDFPIKKKVSTQTFEFIVDKNQKEPQKMERLAKEFDQFLSEDGGYLLNVLDSKFSVHRLKPYISWEDFSPKILLAAKSYLEVFEPSSLERAGVRYINNMSYSSRGFDFDDYFSVELGFPNVSGLGVSTSQFIANVFSFNEDKDKLKIQLGEKVSNDIEFKNYMLDIDYFSLNKIDLPKLEELETWVVNGHQTIEDVFIGIMTQKSKDSF